jgi:hypothetical protein
LGTVLLGELVGEAVRVVVGLTVGDGLLLGEVVLADCPVFCVLPELEPESELAGGGGLT